MASVTVVVHRAQNKNSANGDTADKVHGCIFISKIYTGSEYSIRKRGIVQFHKYNILHAIDVVSSISQV